MNDTRTAIASPLLALAKSRKAMVALISAGINLLVVFAPTLEPHRAELLTFSMALWTVLSVVLINAIAKEDAAANGQPTTVTTGSAETVNVNQQPEPPTEETDTRPLDIPPYTGRLPNR
jgi:hypothetical protein